MSASVEPPNQVRLREGVYLVRTQAGFRKALKEFRATHPDLTYDHDRPRYPSKYPAMVFLSTFYMGHEKLDVQVIHLKELKDILSAIDP